MMVLATVTERLAGGRFQLQTEDGSLVSAVASAEFGDPGSIARGDRVSLIPPGELMPGVIVRLEPSAAPSGPTVPFGRRENRLSPERLKIDRGARPDWPTGAERTPLVGEEVYCTEGLCSVTRVLGRTGNGSRLLELHLYADDSKPYFAAASNVLVHPTTP